MATNIAIISHDAHQLYDFLKASSIALRQTLVTFIDFDNQQIKSADYALFFDFTVQSTSKKIKFLNDLDAKVVTDLSFNNGFKIKGECTNIVAAMAMGIYSPKNCYELWTADQSYEQIIESVFCELEIDLVESSEPGFGFIFPRTLVQIINEAYYSLEENLASAEDIDAAMKSGVNYPLGPIEWAKKSGLKNIYQLLTELFQETKEARYKPSAHLLK